MNLIGFFITRDVSIAASLILILIYENGHEIVFLEQQKTPSVR